MPISPIRFEATTSVVELIARLSVSATRGTFRASRRFIVASSGETFLIDDILNASLEEIKQSQITFVNKEGKIFSLLAVHEALAKYSDEVSGFIYNKPLAAALGHFKAYGCLGPRKTPVCRLTGLPVSHPVITQYEDVFEEHNLENFRISKSVYHPFDVTQSKLLISIRNQALEELIDLHHQNLPHVYNKLLRHILKKAKELHFFRSTAQNDEELMDEILSFIAESEKRMGHLLESQRSLRSKILLLKDLAESQNFSIAILQTRLHEIYRVNPFRDSYKAGKQGNPDTQGVDQSEEVLAATIRDNRSEIDDLEKASDRSNDKIKYSSYAIGGLAVAGVIAAALFPPLLIGVIATGVLCFGIAMGFLVYKCICDYKSTKLKKETDTLSQSLEALKLTKDYKVKKRELAPKIADTKKKIALRKSVNSSVLFPPKTSVNDSTTTTISPQTQKSLH